MIVIAINIYIIKEREMNFREIKCTQPRAVNIDNCRILPVITEFNNFMN